MTLPPWIQVTPDMFSRAYLGGLPIGASIASERNRAAEANARMQMSAQAEAQQAARQESEDRRRVWEAEQRYNLERLGQEGVNSRALMSLDALNANRLANLDMAEDRLGETQRHNMALEGISKTKAERDMTPAEWERDPNKTYVTGNGAVILPRKPSPAEMVTVTVDNPGTRGVPGIPGRAGNLFLSPRAEVPAVPATPPSKVRLQLPVGSPLLSNYLSGAAAPMGGLPPVASTVSTNRVRRYNPATGKIE